MRPEQQHDLFRPTDHGALLQPHDVISRHKRLLHHTSGVGLYHRTAIEDATPFFPHIPKTVDDVQLGAKGTS